MSRERLKKQIAELEADVGGDETDETDTLAEAVKKHHHAGRSHG